MDKVVFSFNLYFNGIWYDFLTDNNIVQSDCGPGEVHDRPEFVPGRVYFFDHRNEHTLLLFGRGNSFFFFILFIHYNNFIKMIIIKNHNS